jgi:hypothetical protein
LDLLSYLHGSLAYAESQHSGVELYYF